MGDDIEYMEIGQVVPGLEHHEDRGQLVYIGKVTIHSVSVNAYRCKICGSEFDDSDYECIGEPYKEHRVVMSDDSVLIVTHVLYYIKGYLKKRFSELEIESITEIGDPSPDAYFPTWRKC